MSAASCSGYINLAPPARPTATAAFSVRALALAIDGALLAAVHFLVLLLAGRMLIINGLSTHPPALVRTLALFLPLLLLSPGLAAMSYFTVLHAWGGQTVGKLAMGIKVVTTDGAPLTIGIAFLRWTGSLLSLLPFGAGYLWAVLDRDQRTWHDRLAGTTVVSA